MLAGEASSALTDLVAIIADSCISIVVELKECGKRQCLLRGLIEEGRLTKIPKLRISTHVLKTKLSKAAQIERTVYITPY
jgi:hypothetical protein